MLEDSIREQLMEAFLYETFQLIEKAEYIAVNCEKEQRYDNDALNEIFRIMHTIKGSSAMMQFERISNVAHTAEDLFFYIREKNVDIDHHRLGDIVLAVLDFMKAALECKGDAGVAENDFQSLLRYVEAYLEELKGRNFRGSRSAMPDRTEDRAPAAELRRRPDIPDVYPADKEDGSRKEFSVTIRFAEDCRMESIRSYLLLDTIDAVGEILESEPDALMDYDAASELIRRNGFKVIISTELEPDVIKKHIEDHTIYLEEVIIKPYNRVIRLKADINTLNAEEFVNAAKSMHEALITGINDAVRHAERTEAAAAVDGQSQKRTVKQNYISVNVNKLDKLMDLVGEIVISELMVISNPEVSKLKIKSFIKAANQLRKMTSELQDIVMSIRMVPIAATFQSMYRIVRDMSRKLDRNVRLELIGENTEVDKNVIELITDPLIHIIRNAIDHGIESPEVRASANKAPEGRVVLEAKHEGGDVFIIISDDGKGLDREAILKKAAERNLLVKAAEEYTDKEVWQFILAPGFSTKDKVSEFSGRGVGMDVVTKNIERIGGRLYIDSKAGEGSTFTVRIPLTLAIMNGMEIMVGNSRYTIPTVLIRETFRPKGHSIITDSSGNELIMIRGECYEVIRIHRTFNVKTGIKKLEEGIILVVENEAKSVCIFADRLNGEHQVVIKPVPSYFGKIDGISGCTILGDGGISLIIDVAGLIDRKALMKRGNCCEG